MNARLGALLGGAVISLSLFTVVGCGDSSDTATVDSSKMIQGQKDHGPLPEPKAKDAMPGGGGSSAPAAKGDAKGDKK